MPLETLKSEVLCCSKCGLAATRNHVIFGERNPHAKILIIGEARGRDEDPGGRPLHNRVAGLCIIEWQAFA